MVYFLCHTIRLRFAWVSLIGTTRFFLTTIYMNYNAHSNKNLPLQPQVKLYLFHPYRGLVIAKRVFDKSVGIGSLSFIYTEILKLILFKLLPYMSCSAKMTVVLTVKSSTVGEPFDYSLGNAFRVTSYSGEILPRSTLEFLMYQLVNKMCTNNSSRGELLAITLRLYLLRNDTTTISLSPSVNALTQFHEIRNMVIEPKGCETRKEPTTSYRKKLESKPCTAPF